MSSEEHSSSRVSGICLNIRPPASVFCCSRWMRIESTFECTFRSTFECTFRSIFECTFKSIFECTFESTFKSMFECISIRSKLASDAFLILTSKSVRGCINSRLHPADDAPYKCVSAQALLSRVLIGVQFKAKERPQKANVICLPEAKVTIQIHDEARTFFVLY